MGSSLEWSLWSAEQLAEALPALVATVESRLEAFPDEHREKNRAAAAALKSDSPTPSQVRDGSRSRDLTTLGFALDVLGRESAHAGSAEEAGRLFQAAHELFRRGNPLMRATKPMRQTLGNAVRVLIGQEVARIRAGETGVAAARDAAHAFVTSAWGAVPSQLALDVNEMLLVELERARTAGEVDAALQERLVRDNIEALLGLPIPTRLEPLRRRWEELGERVAPAAVRRAQRAVRRAEPLSALLPPAVWAELRHAVERGDVDALGHALDDVRDDLDQNLRLRLDAKMDYREPAAELRIGGAPDPAFIQARELLLRRDARALDELSDLHYRRSANTIAKEWYAYALTVFGHATDVHDVIELLEAAIASDRYREDHGWTARWNLACALRRLPPRAGEALDVLLPLLDGDVHPVEVFEVCLLWALEQGRGDVLGPLLPRARYHEAHLLAALADAEARADGSASAGFRDHFRRVNRILRDPDRVFPDPRERLTFDELDRLTRDFVEASLVTAGVEWFRQRVAYAGEGGLFKNWECAAGLAEEAGDLAASWRCRARAWKSTQHKRNVDARKKTQLLRALLAWGQRHGFSDEARHLLRQSWRDTSMSEADARMWEQRLVPGAGPASGAEPGGREDDPGGREDDPGRRADGARRGAVPPGPTAAPRRAPLALMLDWENIKISLARCLDELPEPRAQALRGRLAGLELATRLRDAAWRHGLPRQQWAVADWDRPFFEGDQKAVRNARFWSDIASGDKANASDHVLREKIHFVLREYPEILTFVIGTGDGDFHEVIKTLQAQGKEVIVWSTRRAVNEVFGESLSGPDRIRIEWLEDLVFGDDALAP